MRFPLATFNPFKRLCGLEIIYEGDTVQCHGIIVQRKNNLLNVVETFDDFESLSSVDKIPICLTVSGDHILFGNESFYHNVVSDLNISEFIIQSSTIWNDSYYFLARTEKLFELTEKLKIPKINIISLNLGPVSVINIEGVIHEDSKNICFGGHAVNVSNKEVKYQFNGSTHGSFVFNSIDPAYLTAYASTIQYFKKAYYQSAENSHFLDKNREYWKFKLLTKQLLLPIAALLISLIILRFPLEKIISDSLTEDDLNYQLISDTKDKLDSINARIDIVKSDILNISKIEKVPGRLLNEIARNRVSGIKFNELIYQKGNSKANPRIGYFVLKGVGADLNRIHQMKESIESLPGIQNVKIEQILNKGKDTFSFFFKIELG